MIPSFRPGIISSNRIRAAATADNTPNAVDWTIPTSTTATTNTSIGQQITGIDSSITLQLNLSGTGVATVSYGTNSTNSTPSTWTQIGSGAPFTGDTSTFSISNNQWVFFQFTRHVTCQNVTVTIKNVSNSNTTLDTFSFLFGLKAGC
jgi:hypothetical protein